MATISSPGIGSGLDIKSIVSQLVALEKKPLTSLQVKAATVQSQVSAYGQIKSLVSTLSDAAGKLNSVTGWNGVTATSSNATAVAVSAVGGTNPTSFSVEVQGLAKAQATASGTLLPVGGALGAGTLRLELGKWSIGAASFTPAAGGIPVDVVIGASDTVTDIASKINGANAGVTATVLTDASGERLLLRSKNTGEDAGFQLTVTDNDGNNTDNAGLSRLVSGSTMTQQGQNATATINGIAVSSASNTFSSIPGVTLTVAAQTTAPVEVSVSRDMTAIRKNIDDFVKAYNDVNQTLTEATKYDAATKTPGLLQGDSTANGLQTALRGILQSTTTGGAFARLADIGITQQLGGNLAVNSTKLDAALQQLDDVKNLFKASTGNTLTDGVATKLKSFATGLLATSGLFSTKDSSLKQALERNSKEQATVNDRVSRIEAQLNKRYSALDAQLSGLNSLNAYVAQQVTTWNKSTG